MSLSTRGVVGLCALTLCTCTQAYPGKGRPASEIAVIEGAAHVPRMGPIQNVVIETIDGEEWRTYLKRAELLPGEHGIGVRLGSGPAFEKELEATRRTLALDLEAGHHYSLYIILDPLEFLVASYPPGEPPGWPQEDWDPPQHAVVCTSRAEDAALLLCPRVAEAAIVLKASASPAPRAADCSVAWLLRDDPLPPGAIEVGDIAFAELGILRVCDEERAREKVRERACELGADADPRARVPEARLLDGLLPHPSKRRPWPPKAACARGVGRRGPAMSG